MIALHVFILVILFVCAQGRSVDVSRNVLEYNDEEFPRYMGSHNLSLVLFYTPWCPHCKKVQPVFEESGRMLRNCTPPVTLVKINCRENPVTCKGYKVQKYPTFKLLLQGFEVQDYNGPREKGSMVEYMKSYTLNCIDDEFEDDNYENIDTDQEVLARLLEKLLKMTEKDSTDL